MTTDSRNVASVLERVLSAYGFTMQKELSEKLGIASNNISSWLKRGSVPASVLVQCAMDTGSDVTWLVTGEFAKSNPSQRAEESPSLSGKALHEKILSSGGKPVLKRILDAYGFDTQKELADYLDIPTATISTWIRRDYFPGDVVVACAIDTGVSVEWLTNSSIKPLSNSGNPNILHIRSIKIVDGVLLSNGYFDIDRNLVTTAEKQDNLFFLVSNEKNMLLTNSRSEINNGLWLLKIGSVYDIYNVAVLPKSKIRLESNFGSFETLEAEVELVGKVILKLIKI